MPLKLIIHFVAAFAVNIALAVLSLYFGGETAEHAVRGGIFIIACAYFYNLGRKDAL